jgi:hypothetical protein
LVLLLTATAGLLSQAVFEFGPLWLVALQAPAVLYGPYWAVLVSTLGIGGLLIAKLHLERWLMVAVLIIGSLATAGADLDPLPPVVIAAQVVLALVLALLKSTPAGCCTTRCRPRSGQACPPAPGH